MHETPVNGFYSSDIRVVANGCVPRAMYVWEVKPHAAGDNPWDVFRLMSAVPGPDAYPPPALFGCPLFRA